MLLLRSAVQYEVVYAVVHSLECYHDTVNKELHIDSSVSSSHLMYLVSCTLCAICIYIKNRLCIY